MSVGFYITFIDLLTRRYIEQTPCRHTFPGHVMYKDNMYHGYKGCSVLYDLKYGVGRWGRSAQEKFPTEGVRKS